MPALLPTSSRPVALVPASAQRTEVMLDGVPLERTRRPPRVSGEPEQLLERAAQESAAWNSGPIVRQRAL